MNGVRCFMQFGNRPYTAFGEEFLFIQQGLQQSFQAPARNE
jgi:hypothetical protein